MSVYESTFQTTPQAELVVRSGHIIGPEETPAMMVERIVDTLADQEAAFGSGPAQVEHFRSTLGAAMDNRDIVMSTPIMTNAGRYADKPLTACTVPTLSLNGYNRADLAKEINTLHEQGMGTGFNLNDVDNPVGILRMLNDIAVSGAKSGREDRPVGNMAVLSIYHPMALDFIREKVDAPQTGAEWKFNISVDVDDSFMEAVRKNGTFADWNGSKHEARDVFDAICAAATACADPGLIFLDRMNSRNPYPGIGQYKTTAPCAEVGLIEGETCQFGYINVGNFVTKQDGGISIDYDRLSQTTDILVRALDNALEISLGQFASARSKYVMTQKRKIGIGLCGVADALTIAGIPYDSDDSRTLMKDMLSFINFKSKQGSVRLAGERGSCEAMNGFLENRHLEEPPLLESLYGAKSTNTIDGGEWIDLARQIKATKMLRNITTIALPPTGRSALVIDASTGVEPHFTLGQTREGVLQAIDSLLYEALGEEVAKAVIDSNYTEIPDKQDAAELSRVLAVAREISPLGHLAMAAAMQEFTDESISKTVNLPEGSDPEEVSEIYDLAYESGMSGITIYVDGTHGKIQPKAVK